MSPCVCSASCANNRPQTAPEIRRAPLNLTTGDIFNVAAAEPRLQPQLQPQRWMNGLFVLHMETVE